MEDFVDNQEWQRHLISGGSFLDVRAPVEFISGSIPKSLNVPILSDQERHLVGICYKEQGPEAAVSLGQQLVTGKMKDERIEKWRSVLRSSPGTMLYCFRGGQRSAIAQAWLKETGVQVPRIRGGYKVVRNYLLESMAQTAPILNFITLGGHTGSGKTRVLRELKADPTSPFIVDLEALSHHRGSAFGEELDPQPSQSDFENSLAVELLRAKSAFGPVWWEDESRTIGRITLSDAVFTRLRTGPLVLIEESRESRAELIFQEYVIEQFKLIQKRMPEEAVWAKLDERLTTPVLKISSKLGGERTQAALDLIRQALEASKNFDQWDSHKHWVIFLLENYYDSYYQLHAERQAERVVFRGTRAEVAEYILAGS